MRCYLKPAIKDAVWMLMDNCELQSLAEFVRKRRAETVSHLDSYLRLHSIRDVDDLIDRYEAMYRSANPDVSQDGAFALYGLLFSVLDIVETLPQEKEK